MVDQRNTDNLGRLLQTLGHTDVMIARRGISAGVIVDCNDAVRRITDHEPKHLSRVDQAVPQGAHSNLMALDGNILRVQRDSPEIHAKLDGVAEVDDNERQLLTASRCFPHAVICVNVANLKLPRPLAIHVPPSEFEQPMLLWQPSSETSTFVILTRLVKRIAPPDLAR